MFGLTSLAQSSFAALGGNTYLQDLTESAAASETQGVVLSIPVSVSEFSLITVTAVSTQAVATAIQESSAATDSFAVSVIWLASLNESVAATETVDQVTGKFVYIVETAAINDAYNAAGSIYSATITESDAIQDTVSPGAIYTSMVDESISATDTQAVTQALNALIHESVTASDVYAVVGQLIASIVESVTAGATDSGTISYAVNITETASATETNAANNVATVLITESAAPTETLSASLYQIAEVLESTAATDSIAYTVDTKGIVTGVLITISLSSPLVWNPIDNDQNPDWVQIKD